MRGAFLLGLILVGIALLVLFGERDTVMGLEPHNFASIVSLGAVGIAAFGWMLSRYRGRMTRALEAIAYWLALIVALVGGYTYRFELAEVANRISGALVPGWTIVGRGGEVIVSRDASGAFVLNGQINGTPVRFLFDTGASSVVMTPEAAAAAGIRTASLDYSVTVSTANGRTQAAPVMLDSLAIGPIVENRVRALVARPGALRENLLGGTFLDRLTSYQVQGDRLVLRGRGR